MDAQVDYDLDTCLDTRESCLCVACVKYTSDHLS